MKNVLVACDGISDEPEVLKVILQWSVHSAVEAKHNQHVSSTSNQDQMPSSLLN